MSRGTTPDPETGDLFADPEGYYPPTPPPTTQEHELPTTGRRLTLHLVGQSPTEAHHLWNGARVAADYLEAHPDVVAGRCVLELGAGAGLPSIVAGLLGARRVVATDYPDVDVVATLRRNVREAGVLAPDDEEGEPREGERYENGAVVVRGYIWGADPGPLLAELPEERTRRFDVLILADLLFRHKEHGKLVDTIEATLRRSTNSQALVFFTSYRPWLQHKDLAFFDVARARGFEVEKIVERKMDRPLFENDPGDEEILKTVTGWSITWPLGRCDDQESRT